MEELNALLDQRLTVENPDVLVTELASCEAWASRVSEMLAEAKRVLADHKNKFLDPKSKEYTDLDRQIRLDGRVQAEQKEVDILADKLKIIQTRISLGQTILSKFKEELKSKVIL